MPFIPVSAEAARAFQAELDRTMFGSPEMFFRFFNSGVLSPNNQQIKMLRLALMDTYLDVRYEHPNLLLISEAEVFVEQVRERINVLALTYRLRRVLGDLVQAGVIDANDYITITDTGGVNRHSDGESLYASDGRREVEAAEAIRASFRVPDVEGDAIRAGDLIDISTHPIEQARQAIGLG